MNSAFESIFSNFSKGKEGTIFSRMCFALEKALNANFVLIATVTEGSKQATTLALVQSQTLLENLSFDLSGTLGGHILSSGAKYISQDVQSLYPEDSALRESKIEGVVGVPITIDHQTTGVLLALYQKPMVALNEVESFFTLFASFIEQSLTANGKVPEMELIHSIIQSSNEAIVISDSGNRIIYTNSAFSEITGYAREEIYGRNPKIMSSGIHDRSFYRDMWHRLKNQGAWQGEIYNKRKNGEIYAEWLSIKVLYDNKGKLDRYISHFSDITDKKTSEQQLFRQANYDPLTHLANRSYLLANINSHLFNQHESPNKSSLVVFDIDNFRHINFLFDPRVGDQVLRMITDRITRLTSSSDTLARLNGDVFAIYFSEEMSLNALKVKIQELLNIFNQPFFVNKMEVDCKISLGAVLNEDITNEALSLLDRAEQAHSEAKKIPGINSYEIYNSKIKSTFNRLNKLSRDLEKAIINKELEVYFQPIFNLKKQKFTKLEALARWTNEGEFISPAEFIPIAEKFGLIKELGEFVLQQSCQLIRDLSDLGIDNVVVALNRSVYECPSVVDDNCAWLKTIKSYAIPASKICFELTEGALATEQSNCTTVFKKMQSHGSLIAIDDFGTGYSSLNYLRKFSADVLKIDRSFVNELFVSDESTTLVNAIISMAQALNMTLVAEGVETKQQANYLQNKGVDFIQGYYYAKPQSYYAVKDFLTHRQFAYNK